MLSNSPSLSAALQEVGFTFLGFFVALQLAPTKRRPPRSRICVFRIFDGLQLARTKRRPPGSQIYVLGIFTLSNSPSLNVALREIGFTFLGFCYALQLALTKHRPRGGQT